MALLTIRLPDCTRPVATNPAVSACHAFDSCLLRSDDDVPCFLFSLVSAASSFHRPAPACLPPFRVVRQSLNRTVKNSSGSRVRLMSSLSFFNYLPPPLSRWCRVTSPPFTRLFPQTKLPGFFPSTSTPPPHIGRLPPPFPPEFGFLRPPCPSPSKLFSRSDPVPRSQTPDLPVVVGILMFVVSSRMDVYRSPYPCERLLPTPPPKRARLHTGSDRVLLESSP